MRYLAIIISLAIFLQSCGNIEEKIKQNVEEKITENIDENLKEKVSENIEKVIDEAKTVTDDSKGNKNTDVEVYKNKIEDDLWFKAVEIWEKSKHLKPYKIHQKDYVMRKKNDMTSAADIEFTGDLKYYDKNNMYVMIEKLSVKGEEKPEFANRKWSDTIQTLEKYREYYIFDKDYQQYLKGEKTGVTKNLNGQECTEYKIYFEFPNNIPFNALMYLNNDGYPVYFDNSKSNKSASGALQLTYSTIGDYVNIVKMEAKMTISLLGLAESQKQLTYEFSDFK